MKTQPVVYRWTSRAEWVRTTPTSNEAIRMKTVNHKPTNHPKTTPTPSRQRGGQPHLPYEAHPDHVNTGLAVMQAVLFHGIPRIVSEYRVESPPPMLALGATAKPNALVCIDDYMDRKMRAHRTQFSDELLNIIETLHSKLGEAAGCRYAEAFRVLRPSELHMNPLAGL